MLCEAAEKKKYHRIPRARQTVLRFEEPLCRPRYLLLPRLFKNSFLLLVLLRHSMDDAMTSRLFMPSEVVIPTILRESTSQLNVVLSNSNSSDRISLKAVTKQTHRP